MPITKRGNTTWLQRLRKMNRGRAPRVPRAKTYSGKLSRLEMAVHIENWWKRRTDERVIFETISDVAEPMIDYRGDMPWPKYVSLSALHYDFQSSTGVYVNRYTFGHILREISGGFDSKTFSYAVKDRNGEPMLFRSRTYYDMSEIEYIDTSAKTV